MAASRRFRYDSDGNQAERPVPIIRPLMRAGRLAAVLLAAVMVAPAARATVVTEALQGIVTGQTGDVDALFGTTGGIIGRRIAVTIRYDTGVFGALPSGSNAFGHFWDSTDGSLPNGAVRMTQTINGVTLTYDGRYFASVLVAYGCSGAVACGPWPYSLWTQTYGVVAETATQSGVSAAQINLGALDSSVTVTNPALDPAGPFDLAAAQVGSNGANWVTPTLAAGWSYDIAVPEPPAIGVLTLGAALLPPRLKGWRRKPA
jgi:hypothetical protein